MSSKVCPTEVCPVCLVALPEIPNKVRVEYFAWPILEMPAHAAPRRKAQH